MTEAWLTPAGVASFAQVDVVEGNDALADATRAAVALVEDKRRDLQTGQAEGFLPTDDVILGAKLLAARLYERRGSLLGVAGYANYEGAAPMLLNDPDIERLLKIGRARPFGFGAAQ